MSLHKMDVALKKTANSARVRLPCSKALGLISLLLHVQHPRNKALDKQTNKRKNARASHTLSLDTNTPKSAPARRNPLCLSVFVTDESAEGLCTEIWLKNNKKLRKAVLAPSKGFTSD